MKGFIYNLALVLSLALTATAHAEQPSQPSSIAQAAFGAAAVIAVSSAAAAAGIMANSQSEVASIQATTAMQTTQIQSQTALYLGQLSAASNLFNANLTRDLFYRQKEAEKEDLLTNVRFLANERAQDRQLEREKTAEQVRFQRALLGLKYQELAVKTQIELATINARLVSAGMASPLTPVNTGLSITSAGSAASSSLVANSPTPNILQTASVGSGLNTYYGQALSSGSTRSNRRLGLSDLGQFRQSTLGLVPHRLGNTVAGEDVVRPSQNVRRHGSR